MLNVRYCLWRLSIWLLEGLLNIEIRLCPTTLHSDDLEYKADSPIDLWPVSGTPFAVGEYNPNETSPAGYLRAYTDHFSLYSPELTQDSDNAT